MTICQYERRSQGPSSRPYYMESCPDTSRLCATSTNIIPAPLTMSRLLRELRCCVKNLPVSISGIRRKSCHRYRTFCSAHRFQLDLTHRLRLDSTHCFRLDFTHIFLLELNQFFPDSIQLVFNTLIFDSHYSQASRTPILDRAYLN